ncbi:MAG TPA: acyloxyacyl hydrolase [Vicinamibacteria bacterium]|nr:acyloxyacyl hydrolase [Vicinamibacteria bacterium]
MLCRRLVPVLGLLAAGVPALASGNPGNSSLAIGTGWFDCNRRRDQAIETRIEYRRPVSASGLQAVGAGVATTDGSIFVGGGIAYAIPLGRFDLTPSFVPGLYRQGTGKDLGYPVEFRSQLEAGARLGRRSRVALAFSHTSNGGLGSANPGQESLTLTVQVPLGGGGRPR